MGQEPDQAQSQAKLPSIPPPLDAIVRAGARLNREVPGAVALGGTVCAMYAHHRLSLDIDFVMKDLRDRFQDVKELLLELPGWKEAKVNAPVQILGSLDGTPIRIRQLRREAPLDTVTVQTADGPLVVPTLIELLRIKAFLASQRNYTRDYMDFAELSLLLPAEEVVSGLCDLDAKVGWSKQPSVSIEVMKALVACEPLDGSTHGFSTFRFIKPALSSWEQVQAQCRFVGAALSLKLLGEG